MTAATNSSPCGRDQSHASASDVQPPDHAGQSVTGLVTKKWATTTIRRGYTTLFGDWLQRVGG
jgi:hypothetical protein